MTGFGNRPTSAELQGEARKAEAEIHRMVDDMMAPTLEKVKKAQAKYGPLVANLSREDFIALKLVVEAEIPNRLAQLVQEYPFLAREVPGR